MARKQKNQVQLGIDASEGTATQKALAKISEEATKSAKTIAILKSALADLAKVGKAYEAGYGGDYLRRRIEEEKVVRGVAVQEQTRLKIVNSIEAGLRDQQNTIQKINASMDPTMLKKRVELSIEEQKAREKLAKAVEAETKKQGGGPGIASKIASQFGTVGKSVAAFAGAEKGEGVGAALGVLGPAAIAAGVGLAGFASVAKASPGAMERLTLVFDDMAATVGQTLLPVVEFLTSVTKTFGDILATVLPPADSLREILAPIAETFRSLAEALAPVFELIQNVLIVALKGLAIAVQVVMIPFRILAEFIKGFLGNEDAKLKSSTGAAARSINFTSAESGAKSFYAAAYKTGQAGGGEYQSPLKAIQGTLTEILGVARDIGAAVGVVNPANTFKNFAEGLEIRDQTRKKAGEFQESREGLLKDIKEEIDKSGGNLGAEREKIIRKVLENMKGGGVSVEEISEKHFFGKDKAERLLDDLNEKKKRAQDGFP